MKLQLFFSTFVLIFLAELGDKTQLAAMAKAAAGEGGKWTVFVAASAALVVSTLVAVLFGGALTRVVPERVIKMVAGGLFIVFGVLILFEVFRPARQPAASLEGGGFLTRVALTMAVEFEQAASNDYRRLAGQASDPGTRRVLLQLAEEEQDHCDRVRGFGKQHGEVALDAALADALPSEGDLTHDVSGKDQPLIEHAIEHEETTARFYEELARVSPLPALKHSFAALAEEERDHVRRLKALAPQDA